MEDKKKYKILLCEDDTNLGMVLKNYLEINDYDVTLERDGRLGLAAFQREKYDICLLDVMMPNMDGMTCLKRLRERSNLVPVLIVTAFNEDHKRIETKALGASDFILKPDLFERLPKLLEKYLK